MKLGVQLFGCMKYFNADPEGFLTQLKERGYDVVEPCVSFGDAAIPFAWHAGSIDAHVERVRLLETKLRKLLHRELV